MDNLPLPEQVIRVEREQNFCFSCHPQVPCFTDCCRELELALTPYDVLRLRYATGLSSGRLLEQYIIVEQTDDDIFPRFYLTMIDDGRASCVFVSPKGCRVYEHRPGACRAYPTGRGAAVNRQGEMKDIFILLKEGHCRGYEEPPSQTVFEYQQNQGLEKYNHFNDKTARILQHQQVREGRKFTSGQIDYFTLALYDLDNFRKRLWQKELPSTGQLTRLDYSRLEDDEALLDFGINWLLNELFEKP
ncbi:MAG: zinc/iron-chelating domain-containing protein [Deltaproteobacteria bacterium]|nr:MAG: zinc/iron-chelating domain-containing protein [Deltaproteobacteria bacterium]